MAVQGRRQLHDNRDDRARARARKNLAKEVQSMMIEIAIARNTARNSVEHDLADGIPVDSDDDVISICSSVDEEEQVVEINDSCTDADEDAPT